MRQKIENNLIVEVEGVDLTTCSGLEFYVKQSNLFFQYEPEVKDAGEMLVRIPFSDAMKLRRNPVQIQFAYTDKNGNPDASETVEIPVDALLKESGYDPH